jgi:hypothetical protein
MPRGLFFKRDRSEIPVGIRQSPLVNNHENRRQRRRLRNAIGMPDMPDSVFRSGFLRRTPQIKRAGDSGSRLGYYSVAEFAMFRVHGMRRLLPAACDRGE